MLSAPAGLAHPVVDQPLAEVASLMTNKDVDRVPVVEEGRLVGFLTRGDIVRKLIGS